MPDNPNDRGDKAPAAPLRDSTDKLFDDSYKKLPVFIRPGVCASCHPNKEAQSFDLKAFDLNSNKLDFGRFDKFKDLPLKAPPEKPAEVQVKTAAEKFAQADALDKTATVLSRLPANLKISFADNKLVVQTDFAKLAEATPGVNLGDAAPIFSAIQKFTAEGNTFTLDMKDAAKVKIDQNINNIGKLTDLNIGNVNKQVKFDVEFDAKNPDKVSIKNISGISIGLEGKNSISIHSVTLDTSDGKAKLSVMVDNPLTKPDYLSKDLWPSKVPVSFDLDKVVPGMSADFIKGMVKTLADSKTALQNKDASMLLSGLPDEGIRTKLLEMMKNLVSVEKKDNQITITRSNGVTEHDFGGPKLSVSPVLSFKLDANAGGIKIKDINGVTLSTALPPQAGLGNSYSVGIKGIEVSPKYGDSRALTISADKLVDSVNIRLKSNEMVPATDADGNWRLDIRMTNPLDIAGTAKINLPLRFDQAGNLNMTTGEILAIAGDTAGSGIKSNVKQAVQVLDTAATITKTAVKEEIKQKVLILESVYDYWRK